MMTAISVFVLAVWIGGVGAAYRKDRARFGRIRAAGEALGWPCGLGYVLASRFYRNEDWPDEIDRRARSAGIPVKEVG